MHSTFGDSVADPVVPGFLWDRMVFSLESAVVGRL